MDWLLWHTAGHPGRLAGQGRPACWGGGRTPSRRHPRAPCPECREWRAVGRAEATGRAAAMRSCSPQGWGHTANTHTELHEYQTSEWCQRLKSTLPAVTQFLATLLGPWLNLPPSRLQGWRMAQELDCPLLAGLGKETYRTGDHQCWNAPKQSSWSIILHSFEVLVLWVFMFSR